MRLSLLFRTPRSGALQKGVHDPWLTRGAIDGATVALSLPLGRFFWAGLPPPDMWPVLLGVVLVHFLYKLTIALAYERAAYTVVYPVVRGTGPIVTVLAAMVVFGESYGPVQWLGVGLLSGGILLLALRNLSEETLDLRALKLGLLWAMAGGCAGCGLYDL